MVYEQGEQGIQAALAVWQGQTLVFALTAGSRQEFLTKMTTRYR